MRGEGQCSMWNIGSFSFERLHAPVRRFRVRLREVKFSFACQKRTRKAPATFEARDPTGCGTQRPLRALGGTRALLTAAPNSSSLFPPQAAVVAVARKGLLAPFRPRRGCRNGKKLAASLNAFFSFLRFTASPKILCLRKTKTESECEKELCGHQKERKIIKNQFKKPR